MNKNFFKITTLILSLFLVSACSSTSTQPLLQNKVSSETVSTKQADKPAFVGTKEESYFICVFKKDAEYWKGVYRGFKTSGDQLGVRTVFTGCDEYDPNDQLRIFEQIVAKKPKGIALSPINAEIFNEPVKKAMSQGIKVTCFASDSPNSNRMTLVTSDNEKEGKKSAEYLAKKLGGVGEIGIIERPNQTNHAKRIKAFIETLEKEYPNMKIVARDTAYGDENKAAKIAAKMIKDYPNLSLIYCVAGIEGIGAANGVKETGKPVKVFCFDADPAVIDMIKEGTIYAAIQPNAFNQGYWSMLSLFIASNSLVDPISDWKQADNSPLPALIDNGSDFVTKGNCDYYYLK